MTQNTAPEAVVAGATDDLKQQVEFCLSDTYIALNKTLQSSITKTAPNTMSVPLSVLVTVLPTPEAKVPEELLVRDAVKKLENVEVDNDDTVTYDGRSAPNGSRMRECRRKCVVVDKLSADSTPEDVRELLGGCGRIVSVGLCHPRLTASYTKGTFRSHTVHAIVQFATVQDAVRAVETTNFSWRGGPRVTHAMTEFRAPSPLRPRNQNITRGSSTDSSSTDGSTNDRDDLEAFKAQGPEIENTDVWGSPADVPKKKKKKNKSKKGRTKSESDGNKPQGLKKPDQPSPKRDYASWAAATPENRAQPPRFVNSRMQVCAPGAPVVDGMRLRMPRGPDGTRGFMMGRGRPVPVPT